jgi:peptide/nickel transport system ATP-binding protein
MLLEGKNLSFGFKKSKNILTDFSISLNSQERVGLTAPSGRGKTTLCRILAGYLRPHKGQVLLDGEDLHQMKGYCPVQMIWQNPEKAVNPKLQIRHVIEEGDDIDEQIIAGLGIEKAWFTRYPGELSGGELQRFCIARALGEKTKFIIADEITTMLDLLTQSQIWTFLLKQVKDRGIGLLAVTHSDPLLEHVSTRTVALTKVETLT